MAKSKRDQLKTSEQAAATEAEAQLEARDTEQNVDEALIGVDMAEAGADANAVSSAEAAAVNTDNDSAIEASEAPVAKPQKATAKASAGRPKIRSKKYVAATNLLADREAVAIADAIERVKQSSYSKFDGTVELHARLIMKKGSSPDSVRALVQLPGGSSSQVNAVVLTDELIDEIAKTKKANADMYLATPAMMPKVAKVAKILGPQGKMPNPKTGTVTDNPADAIKEIQSGRIEYRADAQGIVHLGVGKTSWTADRLASNILAVLQSIGFGRLRSVSLTSTMGPGIVVDLTRLK